MLALWHRVWARGKTRHLVKESQMTEAQISFTDGKAYERMMGRWSRVVGEQFLRWLDVGKGLRWLDVGCGNGAFTEEIVVQCAPASVMGL